MAKKEKLPSTPESRAAKLIRKADKRSIFAKTFQTAFAIMLSLLLVYSVCSVAFTDKQVIVEGVGSNNVGNNNSNSNNTANNGSSNNSSSNNTDSSGNQGTNNNTSTDNKDSGNTESPKELSASSSTEEVVNYFNAAINKVKPNAKQVTLNSEMNASAGSIEGNLPGFVVKIANELIDSNMGEKISKLTPEQINATTVDGKNTNFPVENETWSSKLTADDVEGKDVKDNGSTYTITLNIKADEPSADTAHGNGHNGKVFSVITVDTINANAGAASSLISDVQTGHKDGKITITVDKATGNVTAANYYFVWTLSLKAVKTIQVTVPFSLEKDFTIAW